MHVRNFLLQGDIMPYIPPNNRPPIDEAVDLLAKEISEAMQARKETSELGSRLRAAFMSVAMYIREAESGKPSATGDKSSAAGGKAEALARCILDTAASYGIQGGWTGELNYAVTRLLQTVPYQLYKKGEWQEPLRYWIYAETVGALTRTAWDLHTECADDYIGNGLCGVFIDIKDEYKRRVNTAYEAAQILKSGDCYDRTTFRTQLVPVSVNGVDGYQEVMLPPQKLQ
jgi:hypothetical protein